MVRAAQPMPAPVSPSTASGTVEEVSEEISPALQRIRKVASMWLVGLAWAYIPANVFTSYAAGNSVAFAAIGSLLLAVAATVMWRIDDTGPSTRYTVSIVLISQVAISIYTTSRTENAYMLDAHMMFFVVSFFLVSYFCIRSIIIVGIYAALHHLVLSAFFPLFVWPNLDLVAILTHLSAHAVFVIGTSSCGAWLALRCNRAFNESHNAMIRAQRAHAEAEHMAEQQRRIEAKAAEDKRQAMHDLADSFEASIKGIVDSVTASAHTMHTSAEGLSTTAEETNATARSVAAASERASANVSTVATAAEELAASIGEITRQAERSSAMTVAAAAEIERTEGSVEGLVEAARKIGAIVKLVADIAQRTNLLALNATIEAARAGAAGKGFAVVAGEVKLLATQTAKATDEITAQIAEMQAATADAARDIKRIGETVSGINGITRAIAEAVEQQRAATAHIADNVQEASSSAREVYRNIDIVSKAVVATNSASKNVLASAVTVFREADTLSLEVDRFVSRVRHA